MQRRLLEVITSWYNTLDSECAIAHVSKPIRADAVASAGTRKLSAMKEIMRAERC